MKRFFWILAATCAALPVHAVWAQDDTISNSNTDLMSGTRSVTTGYKATGENVGVKIGVDVKQPQMDPLLPVSTANPDPLKPFNPAATGYAGAALDIKPEIGPLDSIELGTKAGSTTAGSQLQGGLSGRMMIGGFGITGSQTYSMTQTDNMSPGMPATSQFQIINGLGITVPGVDTQLNLSATQTPSTYNGEAAKKRLSTSLEAVQPLTGPLSFKVGVTDNGVDPKPDTSAKLGVTLGW